MSNKSLILITVFIIPVIIGMMAVILSTHGGIGASPDSVVYIGAARNLLGGRGLTIPFGNTIDAPLTHHAPLYAAILSAIALFRVDPIDGSRWLNVILIGLNISLFCYLILYTTHAPVWLPLVGSLIILLSASILTIHVMAWTEPLFLFFSFLGLFCLSLFIDAARWMQLVYSSILIGLALMTRYAGAALILTGVLGILILSRDSIRKRVLNAAIFGLISSVPFVLWGLRNEFVGNTVTNRQVLFHPIGRENVWQAIDTLSMWLYIPSSAGNWLKFGGVVLILVLLTVAVWIAIKDIKFKTVPDSSSSNQSVPSLIKLLLIFVVVYSAFVVFSVSFLDANTPLDLRILSPLYVSVALLVFYLIARLWQAGAEHRIARTDALVLVTGFLLLSIFKSANQVDINYLQGIGLNSLAWKQSATLAQVRLLPDDMAIYSNLPHAIYFRTGRSAYGLPEKYDSVNNRQNSDYPSELEAMKNRIQGDQGVVVYFTSYQYWTIPNENELIARMPLQVIAETNDGNIYALGTGQ